MSKIPGTGIHEIPEADYHALGRLGVVSKSMLDKVNRSPAHLQSWLAQPEESTDAMILGSATHAAILEPEKFYAGYCARPEGIDARTKDGKEKLAALTRDNPGKEILKAEDFARVEGMMKSIRKKPQITRLLSGGLPEQSVIWQDEATGVLCRARIDYLGATDTLVDLKTTEDATFRAFQSSVRTWRYHVQAYWYLHGINQALGREQFKRFVLIALEKKAPYEPIVYEFDAEAIRLGGLEARQNLKTFAECQKSNRWPGYPDHIHVMTVPVYE